MPQPFVDRSARRHLARPIFGCVAVAALVAGTVGASPGLAASATLDTSITVAGQGSTFVSNFVEQCKVEAQRSLGINVAYQPSGSGAGRTAFIDGTNDFGASDVPFSAAELEKTKNKPFVYIPIAAGGIAVMHNVPGVQGLKLSGPTLASIFAGKIQKWNDKAIVKENPGKKMPNEVIRVIVRSDSSGTSKVFSEYLAEAGAGAWSKGGTSNFPAPPGNGIAQKGSDGVGNYLAGSQGKYGITYAESSFATERKLPVISVVNAAGKAVKPDAAAVTAALGAATLAADGTLKLNFGAKTAAMYPISATAYVIAPQKMDTKKGDVLRAFLTLALGGCQKSAVKAGYAPLPANLVTSGLAAVEKINPGSDPVAVP